MGILEQQSLHFSGILLIASLIKYRENYRTTYDSP